MGTVRLQLVKGGRTSIDEAHAPAGPKTGSAAAQRTRIVDGVLWMLAQQGIAKTTIDDVARAAGCSRATVYRVFPGGKEQLLAEVASTEVARFFTGLAVRMGECVNLEDVLVAGVSEAAARISEHQALNFLRNFEPEVVLPRLAFGHLDEVLATAAAFVAPFLGRFVDHDEAIRVAELSTRIVISYLACPSDDIDISDTDQARRIVRLFVLPGVRSLEADHATKRLRSLAPVAHKPVSKSKTSNPGEKTPGSKKPDFEGTRL